MRNSWLAWSSDPQTRELDAKTFGIKASGLTEIPTSWSPLFICLDVDLHLRWRNADKPENLLTLLNDTERQELERGLNDLSKACSRCIVRSSATVEGLSQRGLLESFTTSLALEDVLQAARKVFVFFDEAGAPETAKLALLIQALI